MVIGAAGIGASRTIRIICAGVIAATTTSRDREALLDLEKCIISQDNSTVGISTYRTEF
jgi:hypothetical protein